MKKLVDKRHYQIAIHHTRMSSGEMLATLRDLQKLTQAELGKLTGMSQANISNLESGRQIIGKERAIVLAKALNVHPAVIMFPNDQMHPIA